MIIIDLALTVYFWSVTVISILFTYLVCLCCYLFVSQRTFAKIYEQLSGNIMIYSMVIPGFWSIDVIDHRQDKTWKNKRYIVVANHISFIDTLLGTLIPINKKFMMGRVFAKIPVFGWLCKNAGHVPVDKNDPSSTVDAVQRAVKSMSDGCSFMLFPEGKRTKGELGKFKTGAYRISQETEVPILPIALINTNKAMRIGGIVSTANIKIVIGEPFHVPPGWDIIQEKIKHTKDFIRSQQR